MYLFVNTMSFKYSVIHLIELVETHPCLWDKSHKDYRDKFVKLNAWADVCRHLEGSYDNLSTGKMKEMMNIVTTKWTHIKDAFLKTIKPKPGVASRKPYHYGDKLQFLLKSYKNDIADDPLDVEFEQRPSQDYEEDYQNTEEEIELQTKRIKKETSSEPFELQIMEEPRNCNCQNLQLHTNDEIFFQSFVPYLNDMSQSEKIELQMDILTSIKRIKQNRSQH